MSNARTRARTRARIEARIKERVAYCVEFELNDPRSTFITITKVEVSSDLSSAKIFYSVYGSQADKTRTEHMLESANGFIRKQVGRVLRMRRIPRLAWIYDDTIELTERMERRISEALASDLEINPEAHPELRGRAEAPEEESDREYLEFLNAQDEEEA